MTSFIDPFVLCRTTPNGLGIVKGISDAATDDNPAKCADALMSALGQGL